MKRIRAKNTRTPDHLINAQIAELADWRGKMLGRLRKLILKAVPGMTEEWKWGTAVWSKNGLVCAAGAFKDHVKLNFFKGAFLEDPNRLFNSGLGARASRAIDLREGDKVDEAALGDLVRAAATYNQ